MVLVVLDPKNVVGFHKGVSRLLLNYFDSCLDFKTQQVVVVAAQTQITDVYGIGVRHCLWLCCRQGCGAHLHSW